MRRLAAGAVSIAGTLDGVSASKWGDQEVGVTCVELRTIRRTHGKAALDDIRAGL
jgi:hypothetical protein